MRDLLHTHRRIILFCVFFTLCFNLSFAGLVRYYPGTGVGGLNDARSYYWMADFAYADVPPPFRYRPLIPTLAGLLAKLLPSLPIDSWDTLTVAIFLVNSSLVSLAALLIMEISVILLRQPAPVPLIAALLYLTAFPVVNGMLAGMVDSGESFFLLLAIWALLTHRSWLLPIVMICGTLAKETTLVFLLILTFVWWIWSYRFTQKDVQARLLRWIFFSLLSGMATLAGIRTFIGGASYMPHSFSFTRITKMPDAAIELFTSRPLLYTFIILLPFSLPHLHKVPGVYLASATAMGLTAIVLGAYADIGVNIYRPLFNTVGPLLVITSACTIVRLFNPGVSQS